jgi:magnesium chelatase subunit D
MARGLLPGVTLPEDALAQIVAVCDGFAIASARAPLFALRAARAHAALGGAGPCR